MAQELLNDDRPPLAAIVGANVYRLRVLRIPKWSRKRLSEESGVSQETIRLLEEARLGREGPRSTGLEIVDRLARAFVVNPSELVRWDEATRVYFHPKRLLHLSAVPAGSVLDQEGNIVAPLPGLG